MHWYTVCLCYGYYKCFTVTKALAERNKAANFRVEDVTANTSHCPIYMPNNLKAYRGQILLETETNTNCPPRQLLWFVDNRIHKESEIVSDDGTIPGTKSMFGII